MSCSHVLPGVAWLPGSAKPSVPAEAVDEAAGVDAPPPPSRSHT